MTLQEIEAAAARAQGHIRQTPLLGSPFLDELAGKRVLVKAECLQHTGSFKARGAWSALSSLPAEAHRQGVLAYSSGNHAQGVAWAAAQHGRPAVIVMPSDAPALKIANTRAFGAEIVLYDRATESREEIGRAIAAERGLTLIKPFDDPMVIAGQGTCGLEIAHQTTEQGLSGGTVLACCGGGGLTAGIALAMAARAPGFTVHPVEPEGFDDATRSLISGKRETNTTPTSGALCDAIVTPQPGELTFPILRAHCGPGIVVSDIEVLRAMKLAFLRLKLVIEPGGAAALAAALFHAERCPDDTIIAVATGGNVDPRTFERALSIDLDP